ncbi:MAG: LytTR family DNA-binding domain-containing protein [Lachnospiraceae bacterium]|nr:LytTR family DNA-binding domain-containing protein [Lachnospiraceae bacterium]
MKQMRIGICDDQPEVLEELRKLLLELFNEIEIVCEILTWTDGREMLGDVDNLHAVFLDIDMPQIDGIELGKRIKEKNPECKIVMATGMVERFKEAFQIRALRFITKPFAKEEVREALQVVLDSSEFTREVTVYNNRVKVEIREKDIEWIKAFDGYAQVYAGGQWYRKNNSLDELEALLDTRMFARTSRESIVNLRWVKEERKGQFMVREESIFITRRRRKAFEKKYREFDLRYRRILEV